MPPTLKQKKVAELILGGHTGTFGEAMRMAGYSEQTSDTPQVVTESKGWQELMDKYLPDKDLAEVHNALLHKKETIVVRDEDGSRVELTNQPDTDAARALDMAYKLKGKYAPLKLGITDEYDEFSDDDIEQAIARQRERGSPGKSLKAAPKKQSA